MESYASGPNCSTRAFIPEAADPTPAEREKPSASSSNEQSVIKKGDFELVQYDSAKQKSFKYVTQITDKINNDDCM